MNPPGIVWIASYPKSGNTWVRCLIANLQADGAIVNLNRLSKILPNSASRAWLESFIDLASEELTPDELHLLRMDAHRQCAKHQIALLKVHDCYEPNLFPHALTRGVIYIVRDPRDVAPSWADHMQADLDTVIAKMGDPDMTMSKAISCYKPQAPQHFNSWSGHVASWLDHAPCPKLILRYESLLADPLGETARLARFLGFSAQSRQIACAVRACRFETLREAEARHGFVERSKGQQRFFRQGQSGAWQTTLQAHQIARLTADHGAMMQRLGYAVTGAARG